eukprot:TRINITY_DN13667_c0_g1_i1.p1 TRINITY_DN13667_c0_g1~~TRINITY_DN13667_c0_g1_i1.p1  ORF type:complete len:100 (-),score=9.05 TRINITY_DN13667_c0_g1_i1:224-523(-)
MSFEPIRIMPGSIAQEHAALRGAGRNQAQQCLLCDKLVLQSERVAHLQSHQLVSCALCGLLLERRQVIGHSCCIGQFCEDGASRSSPLPLSPKIASDHV